MTKADSKDYMMVPTTASGGTKTVKVWYCMEWPEGVSHYFLDNGAECTDLISTKVVKTTDERGNTCFEEQIWYDGGGWLEELLGKSFKGTSKDINELKKWIIYSAIAAVINFFLIHIIYKTFKIKH